MKVTSKHIPPPDTDLPVLDLHLQLTKKECALLRDLLLFSFDWTHTPSGSDWVDLFGQLKGASRGITVLRMARNWPSAYPFTVDNGA